MDSSEYSKKRETEETEVEIKAEPDLERALEETTLKENVEDPEDENSGECVVKKENEDLETLMEPLFVPIKAEPGFQEPLEGTSIDANFNDTENAVVQDMKRGKCERRRDNDDAEALMRPLFVPIKAESDFEGTSEESTVEENLGASESSGEFFKASNKTSHLGYSELICHSLNASSFIQSPRGEMTAMNSRKHFSKSSVSAHEGVLLPSIEGKRLFAVASCSTADETIGQEDAADMLMRHVDSQIEEGGHKVHSDECGDRSTASHQDSFQKEALQSGSFCSSTDEQCFECGQCGKTFKRKDVLSIHMRTHSGDRPFKCLQCGKSFTVNCSLTIHMRKHTGDKPFKCSHCGKSFTASGSLTVHMRKHTGDRPHRCFQCGKSFTTSGQLTQHMRVHRGDRPHKCSQCEKSFTDRSTFTRHKRTHTGDRPYKCTQCGKSFAQSGRLTCPMRTHTGNRPYRCSQCGQSFTESCSLNKHMRKHTGERPYKCLQCGKSFTQSGNLTVHISPENRIWIDVRQEEPFYF